MCLLRMQVLDPNRQCGDPQGGLWEVSFSLCRGQGPHERGVLALPLHLPSKQRAALLDTKPASALTLDFSLQN